MNPQDTQSKFHEMENLLAKIEKRVRFQRGMNMALWGLVVGLFGFYAFYIPRLAKEVLSNEGGPRVLTQVARSYAPKPQELVESIREEIPSMVKRGLDAAESYLPSLEAGLLSEFDKTADQAFSQLRGTLRPMVQQAIQEELPKIRALMEKAKSEEVNEKVASYITESFRVHLAEAIREMDHSLDLAAARLDGYKPDQGQFTRRHLAERQLLFSLIRMAQEPIVQETLKSLKDG